ncbi:MAG TPA: maleylpyruvate isomerase family mycothiol-dependent enzyme [Acidimicrobiia bacterium]|nr:maleylpyruvate isomerase family mycothiol-dependent enzyme [Acidimicrobiia bacterium]
MATTTATKQDYERMTAEEYADLRELLHGLSAGQWDAPSLCAGWKVRHVVGHICVGSQISPWSMPVRLVPYGFSVARASSVLSFRYGEEHTPAELLKTFDWLSTAPGKPGLARLVPPAEFFVDKLIHDQDIRRPLGIDRVIPAEHLARALDAMPRIGGFLKSKRIAKGLRLVATDIDHAVGDGPEVRGPAEAIVLALSGRPIGLPELSGAGVATLRDRIAG